MLFVFSIAMIALVWFFRFTYVEHKNHYKRNNFDKIWSNND